MAMKKTIKYCEACEETYSERFNFCRMCGVPLKAVEVDIPKEEQNFAASATANRESTSLASLSGEEQSFSIYSISQDSRHKSVESYSPTPSNGTASRISVATTTPVNVKSFISKAEPLGLMSDIVIKTNDAQATSEEPIEDNSINYYDEKDLYHVTFVEEKDTKTRNLLLLGAFILVTTAWTGGILWSLFEKSFDLGDFGNYELASAIILEDSPMDIETEAPEELKKDKGGGGGGGGREEPDPISKGRLAPQTREQPLITPTKTIPQMDTELKMQAFTQGPERPTKVTEEPYGDPLSQSLKLSDGPGRGGGQGSGRGTGQGSGEGTGAGTGRGSGMGGGLGTGIGNEIGGGTDNDEAPTVKKGPSKKLNIIFKPRPNYTDEARKAGIQGVVRLRVTFLANGTIGNITPLNNLGYGLTEQAILAARQLKFEPEMRDGVPVTVTRVVEYSFTLY
jgi:TonB family protein